MSRVRTATEFLHKLRKINDKYEQLFRPHIHKIRKSYAEFPPGKLPSIVDECLEAHSRVYVVNALLAALNWRLDVVPETDLPNLVPEAPIQSLEKGTICFLDYLGFERDSTRPLLVVEAKRPSSVPPVSPNFPTIRAHRAIPKSSAEVSRANVCWGNGRNGSQLYEITYVPFTQGPHKRQNVSF